MGKVIALLISLVLTVAAFGTTSNANNNLRPIVGPIWTRTFIEHHYDIQFLPAGMTEAMQILVNESWLGGVSILIYNRYDRSDPAAIRAAAEKCRKIHDSWEQIVCAHKLAEQIGYANRNFDVSGLCRVLALAFLSVMDEIGNPNVFVGQIGIVARSHGQIWGHNLNRITIRSISGMTYAYAVDDESFDGPIVIYPLSVGAIQFKEKHGAALPKLADF